MAAVNPAGAGRGRPAMRVRTDENAPAIVAKPHGHNNAAAAKENAATALPARPLAGKIMGGLRGGARRPALGDISNAPQAKVPKSKERVDAQTTTTAKIVEATVQHQQQQPRQPLVPLHHPQPHQHQQQQQNIYHPQQSSLPFEEEEDDDIEDAQEIAIDTPEKQYEPLEEQFAQVDDEFHDSRSSMDIDSEGDVTEPDETETLSISRTSCIPTSTKFDREELRIVRNNFAEEYDPWDTSMVPEYAEDIFRYMRELEFRMTPNPQYMANQRELGWHMRRVLIEWLIQVHSRFHLLPETLFLTVNIIDRFLTLRNVPINKLQLVGATAIFIASKYEEITCPSVDEIVFMVDNGYSREEVLEAERFMVNMLQFELGWPGPMSFLRRISKADDYEINTRTLAKYLLEVTIIDERFVASPPSYLAAVSHALARRMLNKGHWTEAHMFYSGYTWRQLYPTVLVLLDCLTHQREHHPSVFAKYAEKKFKRASRFVEEYMSQGQYIDITEENVYPQADDNSPE